MSTKLFPYKMKKNTWYRADDVTESDIAVVVDTEREIIWFWEGNKSSARNRSNARELLGQLKKKYIPYKFKRVSGNSPEEILVRLEDLKEQSFTRKIPGFKLEMKDFSRIFNILNIVNSILVLCCAVLLTQILFWSVTTKNVPFTHISVNYNTFMSFIDLNSFILLSAFVLFMISAFFGMISKKGMFSIIAIIAAALVFVAFFMLRIWDIILFYEEADSDILIRMDALFLYTFSLELLVGQAMVLGMITGIIGFRNKEIKIIKEAEPIEEKQIKK